MPWQLPDEFAEQGWALVDCGHGWVKAVHEASGRETREHYPAKHRGLKFVIRDIQKAGASQETPGE